MSRLIGVILVTAILMVLPGRYTAVPEDLQQKKGEQQMETKFSDKILLSVNNGAAGYGTEAECTDATIVIYTDRTIKVFMDTADCPQIADLKMAEEDYQKLAEIAKPDVICSLQVEDDFEVCDGSTYFITLYDENDEAVVSRGGYMPIGEEFWEIYRAISDILEPYEIEEIVDAYRATMEM